MKNMLDTSWSLDGVWCEPSEGTETEWVPGTLEYSSEEGLELNLNGAFRDELRSGRAHPRIIGDASGLGPCTLVDAYTNSVILGGGRRSSLVMTYALLGAKLPAAADLQFHWSSSVLGNLEEWVGRRPIIQDFSLDLSKLAFRYERPEPVVAVVPQLDATVSIESAIHTEPDGWHRNTLVHTARFIVETSHRVLRELPWHLDAQDALRDLVTLFSGTASWCRRVEVKRNDDVAASVVGVRATKAMKRLVTGHMMLPLGQAGVPFEQLVRKWFEHRATYETSHHLFFGPLYAKMPYTEFAFLSTVQALEAFVKAPLSAAKAEATKFQECVNNVLDRFSAPLRDRLYSTSSGFPERIKHTRNYFTHYSKSRASKAYQGVELYHATERVRLILLLAFMLDLGVSEQCLRERVLETMAHKHALTQWQG